MKIEKIRNIAIIAHVDHGKTTLVDVMLRQSGTLSQKDSLRDRVMDSNDLEKERGITILSKNTSLDWQGYRFNIVDTPGHADFGGEVERVLSMVDSVLLLVDAVEGPMPQTRFVTRKAFNLGLNPIVVINKVDRDGARIDWVLDQTFELFDRLGATDEQLDFPVLYASAINGYVGHSHDVRENDMSTLFETIIKCVAPPKVDVDGPLQLQVSSLDYNSYLGVIGIGRIQSGAIKENTQVIVVNKDGSNRKARVLKLFHFSGLGKNDATEAKAGDIISFCGIDNLKISDTICYPEHIVALPPLAVDEPTVKVTFQVNDSPFVGQDGKFITSRKLQERLYQELLHNVALRVENTADPDKFQVSGRGELHLAILIETMRREGYEVAVSRPDVIIKDIDGVKHEPYESLTLDVEEVHQGAVMEQMGVRKADLQNMDMDNKGRVRLDYMIPSRGLIGFHTDFKTMTSGSGLIYHVFDHYGPMKEGKIGQRVNGVMISNVSGKALAYSLFTLQERGRLFVNSGDPVYEGMLVGLHKRSNDLVVNPTKAKQLNNIRAAGNDENLILTPPIQMSLEQAMEFIDDDELVEVTPKNIRLRKKKLQEIDRKRDARKKLS